MLSSLPKLADRAFILGAFLPTLLFVVAGLFLFHDLEPAHTWIEGLTAKDLGQAAYLLLAVWVVAVIILMLNDPLYRFLEGYTYPGWLAERLKRRNRKYLQRCLQELEALHDKWAEQGTAFAPSDLVHYRTLRLDLVKWMPSRESDVLPTRFGNAIKAFEIYPRDIYGADAIVIWPRLASVIPKAFGEKIDDIRSQIDFLINCCLFSAFLSLLSFVRAVYSVRWNNVDLFSIDGVYAFSSRVEAHWLLCTAVGTVATYVFYHCAVMRVPAWGELVMSAFDCYLPALAGQFGFELPPTESKRRNFWTTFSQQLTYRREPNGKSPFRLEKWKQVASKTSDKELERDVKNQNGEADVKSQKGEAEEDGHEDGSEDSL
jgi:hypothetical protein